MQDILKNLIEIFKNLLQIQQNYYQILLLPIIHNVLVNMEIFYMFLNQHYIHFLIIHDFI